MGYHFDIPFLFLLSVAIFVLVFMFYQAAWEGDFSRLVFVPEFFCFFFYFVYLFWGSIYPFFIFIYKYNLFYTLLEKAPTGVFYIKWGYIFNISALALVAFTIFCLHLFILFTHKGWDSNIVFFVWGLFAFCLFVFWGLVWFNSPSLCLFAYLERINPVVGPHISSTGILFYPLLFAGCWLLRGWEPTTTLVLFSTIITLGHYFGGF